MRRAVLITMTGLALLTTTSHANAQTLTTASVQYTTPFRGAASLQTAGLPAGTVVGYTRVQPSSSTTPAGQVFIQSRQNNVLIADTGLPGTTTLLSGRIYVEFNGSVNTAISFANPNPT